MKILNVLYPALLILLSNLAYGSSNTMHIIDPHVALVPPTSKNTAAYMMLHNHSSVDINLISADTSEAEAIELHSHSKAEGIMKMRLVPKILIPAKGYTLLESNSFHLMIIGLKEPLMKNKTIGINLVFDNGEKQFFDMKVRDLSVKSTEKDNKHKHHNHKHGKHKHH